MKLAVTTGGAMVGSAEITVAEKFWCSWQIRHSPLPVELVPSLLSVAGSEKWTIPLARVLLGRLP